jgi:uncharacterized protein (TIGR00369 family)
VCTSSSDVIGIPVNRELSDDRYCFACGPLNPIGLRMEVSFAENRAFSRLALRQEFQGWKDLVHGGVVATILDEIMAHAVIHYVGQAVTTSLQITYRAPLHVEDEIEAVGYVAETKRRVAIARAEISVPGGGKILATGESRFLLVNNNK